jgi:hypothetical protein
MGSTHPPLESLLQFSQSCLEGFELSCLNRIATLRKEFREVLQESIELEIEARFARWVSEHRHLGTSFPNPTALPACVPVQLALRSVAHSSERLLLASGDELPVEFPFASLVELVDSVAFELRPPIRHSPVSHDASASLRSLEHCALCKARAIGDQPIDLLDFDATDSSPSCPFLPFPQFAPVHKTRNVSSQLTYVLAGTDQSTQYVVRYASTFATSEHFTPEKTVAQSKWSPFGRSHSRLLNLGSEYAFAPHRNQNDLCRSSSVQLSLRHFSLRRSAVLLRN